MPLSPEMLYMQLGHLVAETPTDKLIAGDTSSTKVLMWLGRAHALVLAVGDEVEVEHLRLAMNNLPKPHFRIPAIKKILIIIYRAFAVAESNTPTGIRGAFIPVGNPLDAMVAVGKVLEKATDSLLIVDPYMDMMLLTDFACLVRPGVTLHLMADKSGHKPTLKPAVARWTAQYGVACPIEARLAAPGSLHDRLIVVDGAEVWTLTQSFKDLAARSPATIIRVDDETAALKSAWYETKWSEATML